MLATDLSSHVNEDQQIQMKRNAHYAWRSNIEMNLTAANIMQDIYSSNFIRAINSKENACILGSPGSALRVFSCANTLNGAYNYSIATR